MVEAGDGDDGHEGPHADDDAAHGVETVGVGETVGRHDDKLRKLSLLTGLLYVHFLASFLFFSSGQFCEDKRLKLKPFLECPVC